MGEKKQAFFLTINPVHLNDKCKKSTPVDTGRNTDRERYNLSDRLRRASYSILLNIAESYGRYYYLERLRFLYIDIAPGVAR